MLLSLTAINAEIVHHSDESVFITSICNEITLVVDEIVHKIVLPLPFYLRCLGYFRIFRRLLRLDKSSVVISKDQTALMLAYRGKLFSYDIPCKTLTITGNLQQCRTVMHMSRGVVAPKTIIVGEYGHNATRSPVPIHLSVDNGKTWKIAIEISNIYHIHGVYHDPYTGHIWVATGDFEGECFLYEFPDISFTGPKIHGDGSQTWRTVNLFFDKDKVVWLMDSQLQANHLVTLDRATGKIEVTIPFPGPIWYIKSLSDGKYLAQTSVEKGPGVLTGDVHVYLSTDLINWDRIASFPHDGFPLGLFKNAVIAFSNGSQSSAKFYCSAEAIKNMDGKSFKCSLTER